MKKILITLFFIFSIHTVAAEQEQNGQLKELIDYQRQLSLYEQLWKIRDVHKQSTAVEREIENFNDINFSHTPLQKPIQSFDTILVHPIGPVSIIFPREFVVTNATLSNSELPLKYSQNIVEIEVSKKFLSGLVTVDYVTQEDLNKGYRVTLKADKYLNTNDNKIFYTQINYFTPVTLSNGEVLALLKANEYSNRHNEVEYQNKKYNIDLVSIQNSNGEIEKRYLEDKFVNFSMFYNNKNFNYHIYVGQKSN